MSNLSDLGRLLILVGAGVVALGVLLLIVGRVPWLGHLPGDITIRRDNTSIFIPIASCLLASLLLTLLVNVLLWLFRR